MSARCLLNTLQRHARQASSTMDAVVAGGGTIAALHVLAIANECRVADDLFGLGEVFKRTPYIADLKPAGRFVAKDLFDGAFSTADEDIAAQWFHARRLHDHYRCTMAENLNCVAWNPDRDAGRPSVDGDRRRRRLARRPRGRFSGAMRGSGYFWNYAQKVGPGPHGVATRPGGTAEKACHAHM